MWPGTILELFWNYPFSTDLYWNYLGTILELSDLVGNTGNYFGTMNVTLLKKDMPPHPPQGTSPKCIAGHLTSGSDGEGFEALGE